MTPVFEKVHDLTPFVKNKPARKKTPESIIPQIKGIIASEKFFGQEEKELTTPAPNHATPMLERNSAINFLWPTDNSSIKETVT